MDISIVGSGYVGTTLAASLADLGHSVVCIDTDEETVARINDGDSPIHEPNLGELIAEHAGKRLRATTDYTAITETDVTFLALPTPASADGQIDTSIVETGTESIGNTLANSDDPHLVVIKSTVVPGTTDRLLIPLLEQASGRSVGADLQVAVNPEFLSEGSAVMDFLSPDKIVAGADHDSAYETLKRLYEPIIHQKNEAEAKTETGTENETEEKTETEFTTNTESDTVPFVETGFREAEMIKYANNVFLAGKVSMINEIGNICKEYDIDAYAVADAIGLDDRISGRFLRSGAGWGGSCFPKDVAALIAAAKEVDYNPELLQEVVSVNDKQPKRLLALLEKHVEIPSARIAVLGLSFKSGTDDIRGSRAIPVIHGLEERGATVVGYDPIAIENMRERFPDIEYVNRASEALEGADGALVVTDWDEFGTLHNEFDLMRTPVVIDGRRIVSRREGIVYEGLTW